VRKKRIRAILQEIGGQFMLGEDLSAQKPLQ
jgi:hypothetical protein